MQPFDQGVNPSSQKRRAPAIGQDPTYLTLNIPLFEPELQATQTAASAQADDIVGEDEDTFEDRDGDPLPEDEAEVAAEGAAGGIEDEGEPAYRPLEDEVDPILRVRWRACLGGDMEKHFKPKAADSEHGQWVDDVVVELRPKRAKISSICAVVYPAKRAKRERAMKQLRQGVDYHANEPVNVDFELILAEILAEQQPLPTVVNGPRRRTATVIQEEGLAGVIAAEQAGSGHAIAIQDRWRCTDTYCENYPYCSITARKATYDELSNDVRLAIMRAKDLREHEKTRKLQVGGGGNDYIKTLTKLFIVGQLERMNKQPLQESNLQAATPRITRAEVNKHTSNFFNYLKLKFPTVREDVDKLHKVLVIDGAIDINLWMQPSDEILKLWTQRVERCKKREEIARKKMVVKPSSSVVENDSEDT
ncbi:hypothetical protein EK21DRAFT_104990 [Setomelanomma holmii]|uniref:Uncharacterized protein n=1 Tax=Setomelanomma holmii TaxID=210430 RepID=A0A9P4GXW6_9PLEO|nr:hypothetical protein EK21DRAFT_104990 [Setomelanomma holmii]